MKKVLLGVVFSAMLLQTLPLASVSAAPVTTIAAGAKLATTKNAVNLRVGASTSTDTIRSLAVGETVMILGQASVSWYNVQDSQGNMGYVSTDSKYLQITGTARSGQTLTRVNLRTAPSTDSTVIKTIEAGRQFAVINKVNENWIQVWDGEGKVGYMSSNTQYVALGTTETGTETGSGTGAGNATGTGTGNATGTGTVKPPVTSSSTKVQIEEVIATGMKYLGTPYEYGSDRNATTTFDCSAFVRQAYREALGVVLESDSRNQGAWVMNHSTVVTDIDALKRGDLMFFVSNPGSNASTNEGVNGNTEQITHVGIYLGDYKILHTYSKASGGVRIDSVRDNHWADRFLFGGSVL
ncbi:hydrolase Nlp/P60 [Paenibacillus selenitireducens]|uniref:Hydrolase Nlp/P60 n=1 Tax=Paenibacillus selenitireducens TaxID=1324314 RepID=A0A1T2XNQ6_9BACL|nr:C40 family peptidase [Paenibacillus selenitireducens]OPA81356.1 hydrolase Nlp/P60 [Paenibacillus selenitireducens]